MYFPKLILTAVLPVPNTSKAAPPRGETSLYVHAVGALEAQLALPRNV